MGIYIGGAVTDLLIDGNTVEGFANEGIDVHNTGDAVTGISGIIISNNNVKLCSYVGISVVSSENFEMSEVTIVGNTVRNDVAATTFGFSHGMVVEYVNGFTISGNTILSVGNTPTLTSYGMLISYSHKGTIGDNSIRDYYDFNMALNLSSDITLSGNTLLLKASSIGMRFYTPANARYTITGNVIIAPDATATLIDRAPSGLPLQYTTMVGNTFEQGIMNIDAAQHFVLVGNMFNNVGGVITDSGQCLFANNQGWLIKSGASTKATPSAVDAWETRQDNGVTYYIPMYLSQTS